MIGINLSFQELKKLADNDFIQEAAQTMNSAYQANAPHEAIMRATQCASENRLTDTDRWVEVYKVLRRQNLKS